MTDYFLGSTRSSPYGKALVLLLATASGALVGLMPDLIEGRFISATYLRDALILSPWTIPFGGVGAGWPFLAGGLLFWPVYCACAWVWFRRGERWTMLVTFLVCAQGYWRLVDRLQVTMSV